MFKEYNEETPMKSLTIHSRDIKVRVISHVLDLCDLDL